MEIGGVHRLMPLMIQATEYTPGISTISAIVRLALAALEQLQNPLKSAAVQAHHVYKIVSRADIARQCILLVPVLGNVFVATTDYIAHRKTESAKILSQQLQEQVTGLGQTQKALFTSLESFSVKDAISGKEDL